MQEIAKTICQSHNPFENELTPGNFWQEQPNTALMVDSIHQEIVDEIAKIINQINHNSLSCTVIISGDSGSGKSYLLGRIKRTLNQKAFFAYISPWPDSNYIWRHILRQTVDSLVCKPEGEEYSQLILWIKNLSGLSEKNIIQWILGERGKFINNLRATYPVGIYNAKEFFGVLYDLTNPDLYLLACDWLRGDDLDEEDLKKLKVKQSIDSEQAAKNIIANFGRIAGDTQPIVLCFDQLDNIPTLNNGFLDLQSLFNVNSTIYSESFKKFLVIISIITNTWNHNSKQVQAADLARIHNTLTLKQINLQQAEALWAMRLHSLHSLSHSQPPSNIYPLQKEQLQNSFPGGKTLPRTALILGSNLFQEYQKTNCQNLDGDNGDILKIFSDKWHKEYQKTTTKITSFNLIAAPEMIKMFQEVLAALEIKAIKPQLLSGKYNIYSFSYQLPQNKKIGIVWNEDAHMTKFYYVMQACHKIFQQNTCETLYLIRAATVGDSTLKGNKIYQTIFNNVSGNFHIKPTLSDIHYLATYHQLVNSAKAKELFLNSQEVDLPKLEFLLRKSTVMSECYLLQQLHIVGKNLYAPTISEDDLDKVKDYLLANIKEQKLISKETIINKVLVDTKPETTKDNICQALEKLQQENKIKIMNPQETPEAQIICLIPQ